MSFANSSVTDIVATAIESRSGVIADNITNNNIVLSRLSKKKKVRTISGGSSIFEELSFATNKNGGFYSGYDNLPVAAQDVISAAQFSLKQYAIAVPMSGLEELENAGEEKRLDLLEARINVAEGTMANDLSTGIYGDGTASGGKSITGLGAAVVALPTSGTYGGIDRSTAIGTFWRNQYTGSLGAQSATSIQANMNALYLKCVRGKDKPDLIIFDNSLYSIYLASLQSIQRFTSTSTAELGFDSVKFLSADVVYDGGIGGGQAANVGHFLNTDYIFWRPHEKRNMKPLKKREAFNQDASVTYLAWAGNMTCSGAQFQGYFQGS